MSVNELAEILHKSPWYVRKLAREGKIHGIKVIHEWWFCPEEITDMIDTITEEEIKKHNPETERANERSNKGCDIFS